MDASIAGGPTLTSADKHMISHRTGDAMWRNTIPPFPPLPDDAARDLETALTSH